MKTEAIIWGLIPAILAIASILFSISTLWRSRTKKQAFAAFLVVGLSGWSLAVLYAIFVKGAWPTMLGHLAIGAALIISCFQRLLSRQK